MPTSDTEIEKLLERAKSLVRKTKTKETNKRKPCSSCALDKPLYVAGKCKECYLNGRELREEAKIGKRWISTNGLEYTYTLKDGKASVALYSRVRMAELLGRSLHPYEIVSHKDGDKANNNDDNLYLTFRSGFDLSTLVCSCGIHYTDAMKSAASLKEENSETTRPVESFTLIVTPSPLSER
jgi:hypothetical protein